LAITGLTSLCSHHHGLIAVHRHEREKAAEREVWIDGDTIERHMQVGARKFVIMHRPAGRAGSAEDAIDLRPIDRLRMDTAGRR
jgi:hypothetical protein